MASAVEAMHSLLLCAAGQVCADFTGTHVRHSAFEDSLKGAQDRGAASTIPTAVTLLLCPS